MALHDFPIDSLAVTIGDVGQGGNLEMHTYTVDMFVFGGVEGFSCEGVLHQRAYKREGHASSPSN